MRIAIVKLSAMGDIIHAAVVLQFIKARYPDARIEWIVEEGFAPVLAGNPHIDAVHTIFLKRAKKEKSLSLLKALYSKLGSLGEFDHIIDMQGLFKSAIMARLIGKNVCGFDRDSMREGMAAWFYRHTHRISYDMNVILRGAELVSKCLGVTIDETALQGKAPFLYTDEKARASVREYVDAQNPTILVMVGASWPSKIYPAEQMARVIEMLGREVLVVWGSEGEKVIADTIAAATPLARAVRRLTLPELIALVEASALVIGGDTGPVHMAWALNRPSVTIFGPTPSFRNTLTTLINVTVDTGKVIDPSNLDRHDFSIGKIDPVRIAEAAKTLL